MIASSWKLDAKSTWYAFALCYFFLDHGSLILLVQALAWIDPCLANLQQAVAISALLLHVRDTLSPCLRPSQAWNAQRWRASAPWTGQRGAVDRHQLISAFAPPIISDIN